ncbi:lamin-A-like [Scomber scombrus]|uniref:lamin-A-like n=1 Tax=Scomber scombrus TaxID=13677 RepID=UPI002DDB0C08|nr:lamin-A-like [Scomber scombrus]
MTALKVINGQSRLIGSTHPIVARVGDDIILPCHLEPAVNVFADTLEWRRSDLDIFVHVRRSGQEFVKAKGPSYRGRTSLFIEELKRGNISLKLSQVTLSDKGTYKCHIPDMKKQFSVELVVDAAASPVISLAGIDRERGGVVLQCESKGWYPKPEVFWLDGEGNLLSAEPTETVRGPDGLYTVSSRVTVEKRHSNNFTCKVQQSNINQIRETNIIVPDDFFNVQSSSSSAIIGLAVSLAFCIILIVAVFCFVWKWRQNMIKTKRSFWDETEGGNNKNLSKSDTEMQPLNTAETVGETLTVENKQAECDLLMKMLQLHEENQRTMIDLQTLKENLETKIKELEGKQADTDRKLQEEKQNREREVKDLKDQLYLKHKQVEHKQAECDLLMKLLQLNEENQRREERDLQTLKENLETKNKELETMKTGLFSSWVSMKAEKEKEVETLKKELQTKQEEFETKTNEIKEIKAQLQQLRDENQRKETDLQRQTEETNNKERQDASKHKDTNPASKVFVEIDPNGKYLRLTTKSKEDLKLEGWKLRVTVNDQNPITFTFKESITLRAEKSVNIWANGWGADSPPSDLRWKELRRWAKGDKLLIELINCDEEIVKTTEV